MAQRVNIKIKINDNLKDVAVDAESLGKAIDEVTGKSDSLNTSVVKLGSISQLAEAQELATYLEYSDSLKAIIPVMNDMAAQQYGLGASAESVTQIATMLGKVMNG